MVRRLLSLVVLWLFVGTLAVPAVAAVSTASEPEASSAWHADGTPCPDDDDTDHGPCSDGCPCHCCRHGQALAIWLPAPPLEGATAGPYAVAACRPPVALRPNGYLNRIYRPPRG